MNFTVEEKLLMADAALREKKRYHKLYDAQPLGSDQANHYAGKMFKYERLYKKLAEELNKEFSKAE